MVYVCAYGLALGLFLWWLHRSSRAQGQVEGVSLAIGELVRRGYLTMEQVSEVRKELEDELD